MIKPETFLQSLTRLKLEYFTGVPDSLLKTLCAYITSRIDQDKHIIAANEGGAMGLAIGYHLATGKVPVVYMQNSGLGNIVNPLLSMADDQVYGVPMVLLIGWRGEMDEDGGQLKDEPQHKKQGQVTEALLNAMDIEYEIIHKDTQNSDEVLERLVERTTSLKRPVAILIRKGTFDAFELPKEEPAKVWSREEAIATFVNEIQPDSFVVSTTGMPSRELFEQRELRGEPHGSDFLVVGSMGHASQIAAEVSRQYKSDVYCLDGDGSFLMHMGGVAINAQAEFCHIVLNNGAHDSVGGQPTVAKNIDIPAIAIACGYKYAMKVETKEDFVTALKQARLTQSNGACLIEVSVRKGARSDLGRPTLTSQEMKQGCMQFLQEK
ncbi:MAG: phosphonopyruvate decarboxylase [Methylococcaceae bacterium]